jgi:hypothetical protein
MTKSIFKSRTVWVNVATLVAGIAALVAGNDLITDYPQVIAALATFQGALNIVLRLLTTKAIV